ncbi:unnamed protein product [Caenorhabditis auriculariae]|uniref:Uncharacterized protein n=1 Tax=Caenorhabditis auriculariae TaxID=2777116 RepID=A0A8S1HK84_9PELO|nr:unnamed protein product [Caenorhabditis auriculariae]
MALRDESREAAGAQEEEEAEKRLLRMRPLLIRFPAWVDICGGGRAALNAVRFVRPKARRRHAHLGKPPKAWCTCVLPRGAAPPSFSHSSGRIPSDVEGCQMTSQFTKLFSFILANVHDPAAPDDTDLSLIPSIPFSASSKLLRLLLSAPDSLASFPIFWATYTRLTAISTTNWMAADVLQLVSYLLANVSDFTTALRLPCYSCMSPYLEDHYGYISHLYRKPMSFDVHCDKHSLDRNYLYMKNCSDMCITLRIHDVVGGRRRHGYLRGCLSDLQGYNHTVIRGLAERQGCLETTARELFLPTAQRQELEQLPLGLCACHNSLCNVATSPSVGFCLAVLLLIFFLVFTR